jgi:hypothetical protein
MRALKLGFAVLVTVLVAMVAVLRSDLLTPAKAPVAITGPPFSGAAFIRSWVFARAS